MNNLSMNLPYMNNATEGKKESIVVEKSAVVQENLFGEFMQIIQPVYCHQS